MQEKSPIRVLVVDDEKVIRDGCERSLASEGYQVDPAITIPQDALGIRIGVDGTVPVTTAGAPNTSTSVGQMQLARFINPSGLENLGGNLLLESVASGTPLPLLLQRAYGSGWRGRR